ncbi:MAG: phosphate acyltransferase PlsX [Alphaproteobacteria bacterium]
MAESMTIALDVMGGDDAPRIVIEGAELALSHDPGLRFLLFGDEHKFKQYLANAPLLKQRSEVIHTDIEVGMDEKPKTALRKRKSSMWLAIDAVTKGDADCCVSAGNTGVLMGMAHIRMRPLPGIERPAIASVFPNSANTPMVMLDLGANVVCDADNLSQFAVMGGLYAKHVLGVDNPTLGLLNIGSEQMKGNEVVRGAADRLNDMRLPGEFVGFIEGNDIATGKVNVVVTDGFTGNIALKTAEGMAKMYSAFLKETFYEGLRAKLGYLLLRPGLLKLKDRTDPRKFNGAMFLGLHGICVKSHGGTDEVGYCNAIEVARDLVRQDFNDRIVVELEKLAYDDYDDEEDEADADTGMPEQDEQPADASASETDDAADADSADADSANDTETETGSDKKGSDRKASDNTAPEQADPGDDDAKDSPDKQKDPT